MSVDSAVWVDITDEMLDGVLLAKQMLLAVGRDQIEIQPSAEEDEIALGMDGCEPGLIVIGRNGVQDARWLYVGPLGQIEWIR